MRVKSFGYLTALWMLCFSHALIAAPDLTAGQRDSMPGASVSVPFDWVNDGSVVAQQFDLVFDASALNVTNVSAGTAGAGHTLDWQVVGAGRLRVVFSTPVMNAITSGNLVNVDIAVVPHAAVGEYPLIIDDPLFADDQARPVVPTSVLSGNVRVLGVLPPSDPAVAIPVLGWFSMLVLIGILAGLGWLAIRRGIGRVMMSVFLGGILFSSTLVQAATLPGDANNDGKVDALDIPVIVAQILERATAPGNPDCNQDSLVNVLDTVCAAQPPAENQAPVLAAIADQQTVVGQNFSLTAVATDPDSGDVVTYSLDQSPVGMSIGAASGVITWTPTTSQLGVNDVTVRATDQDGLFDTEAFQINVVEIANNRAPTLIPPGNRQIQVNRPFSTTLFATDPDAGDVLTFALTGSPAGMSVHPATGMLTWSPDDSQLGINAVTATVTDAGGLTDSKSFNIEVTQVFLDQATNAPPKLTVPGDQSMTLANLLSVAASATDADGDNLVFELVNAPTGMSIDSASGAINWTPTAAQIGAFDVAVKVSDTHGAADFGSFIVTVVHVNRPPVATDDVYQVRIGDTLSVAVPGVLGNDSDPDNDPLTGSLVSDVAKGSLDFRTDGSFDYTPDKPTGNAKVELEVQCEIGKEASGDYRHRGTLAVGDVDNDGEIEIVGVGGATPRIFMYTVWIISASDCSPKLISSDEVYKGGGAELYSHPGLLDINGDGNLEIIVPRNRFPLAEGGEYDHQHLMAIRHDGTLAWPGNGGSATSAYSRSTADYLHSGPTFADLDGDGTVEILMTGKIPGTLHRSSRHVLTVYNSVDGSIKWEHVGEDYFERADAQPPVVADLDLDGKMEVILHTSVIDHEGNTKFLLPAELLDGQPRHLYSAVANFDSDPYPEIVARDRGHIYLFKHDGSLIWKKVNPNRSTNQIAVADFDGDGEVEFAYSHGISIPDGFLVVYDNDGSVLWSHENIPELKLIHLNHAENITAFDANGDGAVDIIIHTVDSSGVYGTYIFDGRDGSILHFEPASRLSTEQRFLTVADIDGDGEAELIYSSPDGYGGGFTRVWQGTAANPLPPAPPLSTQWAFNQTMFRDDATIISNPTPAWLQPGHNGYHLISSRGEFNLAATTDSFTYKASDGALESNLATVNFDVQPNGVAPMFLSEPDTLTTVGFQYEYAPRVIDYDPGDTVSFMLTEAPNGMTIDPVTGVVRWLPDTNGSYAVIILAYDTIGFATPQAYTLMVGDPVTVPDVVGQPEASAETTLTNANLITGQISHATHPTIAAGSVFGQTPPGGAVAQFGAAVDLSISTGPGPGDIDSDGDGFTPNEGDCNDNDDSIYPGANDPEGDGIDQDCDGIDGNLTLSEILVLPGDSTLLTHQSVNLKATGVFEDGTSQNLSGVVTWSNGPVFSSASPGTYTVTATRGGITGSATVDVVARTADDTPPVAEISAPGNNTTVTEPVDIIGTASDDNFLKYELAYAVAGSDDFTIFASRNSEVNNGVLGQLDPSLLINDLYTLRLTVYDKGGNQIAQEITVQISGNLKVGNFSLNFLDLEIPLSGVPIRINRTYDSRDKRRGDFGYGWNLDINTLRLRTSRVLGTGWEVIKSGLSFGLLATDEHKVSIALPGGRVEEFDLSVTPTVSPLVPFPPLVNRAVFVPRPGTTGKLLSLENNNLSILDSQPGEVQLLDDTSNAIYNPQLYRYTAADGTEFDISVTDGVTRIRKPDGNTIHISSSGITHSSGQSVQFVRDSQGRITGLTDADGNQQLYTYDGNSDLRSHTDREGYVTRFDYNLNHGLLRVTDALGRVISRNEYDSDGRLISTTNADGHTITFTHDPNARQEVITDAAGGTTVIEYDDEGNILKRTDALGGVTHHTYDADGNQTSTTNAEGETTTRSFDARGNKLSETNAEGETTQFTYDDQDHVTSVTDPLGRQVQLQFDSTGNLIKQINALGQVQHQATYDAAGNLIANTDAAGNTTEYDYDTLGNQIAVTDARGHQTSFSYDANGVTTSATDPTGGTVLGQTDARGNITAFTNPLGDAGSFTYNYAGTLVGQTTAGGSTETIDFNAMGQPTAYTNGAGETRTRTYDSRGNLKTVTDANLQVTTYTYDALSRRIATTHPDGATWHFDYDAVGRLIQETDALGNAMQYAYDDAGRNTRISNALGEVTRFEYDAAGNLTKKTDAAGYMFEYEYDALNRLTLIRFPDASIKTLSYDANGNVVSETDAAGALTQYVYDANDNLIRVERPAGEINSFTYDANDRLVTQTDSLGHQTHFEYDVSGQLLRKIWPDGTSEQYSYDADGNRISKMDGNGQLTSYAYDAAARLTTTTFADGSLESYTYTATGRVATSTNSSGTISYSYDNNDRLISKTNPDGSSISYSYDLNGNQIQVSTQLGGQPVRTTDYSYDALNRLASVTAPDGDTTTYGYDAIGNLATISYPNGVVSTFEYDAKSRLSRLTHENSQGVFERYDYTVDPVGNRTRVVSLDGSYIDYAYDSSRRLLKESHYDALASKVFEQSCSYDLAGNRSSRIDQVGNQINYVYNASDQLLSAGSKTYSYDANGNLVARQDGSGLTSYSWSLEDQLSGVQTGSNQIEYAYDAEGERISRSLNSSTTRFLVDGNSVTGFSQSLVDYSGTQTSLSEYTYGQKLIGQNRGGIERFYHRDGSQNVRLLTDSAGSVTDNYNYDAFGNQLNQSGSSDNAYRFSGERFAQPESLLYLRARYYDPDSGRFISRDPFEGILRDSESLHRYLYANSNPVSFTDPSGELSLAAQTMVVSAISGSLVSGTIAAISGKGPMGIVTDAVIGGAFGALGGPLGNALSAAFSKSKILINLVRNPAVARYAARFVGAIPATVMGAMEDISKALSNGDAFKPGFIGNLVAGTFLNFVFNTIAGPTAAKTNELPMWVNRRFTQSSSGGNTIYHLRSKDIWEEIPSGEHVLKFISNESEEAWDLFTGFGWEFAKLMSEELPKFIGRNE